VRAMTDLLPLPLADAVAGWAIARLISQETVAAEPVSRLLALIIDIEPDPKDLPPSVDPDRLMIEVKRLLSVDDQKGWLDYRAMYQAGWGKVHPGLPVPEKLVDYLVFMATCPSCLSFWTTAAVGLVSGRFRPWRARDWIVQFAVWGVASQLARQKWNPPPATGPDHYIQEAAKALAVAAR
jgi:hypothetical protein